MTRYQTVKLGLADVGYNTCKNICIEYHLENGNFYINIFAKHGNGRIPMHNPVQTVKNLLGMGYDDILIRKVLYLEKFWNRNDLTPGTPEQMDALSISGILKHTAGSGYDRACEYLKKVGLYTVQHEGKPYDFGEKWLRKELTPEVVAMIESLS